MWEVCEKREWEAVSPGRAEPGRSGPGLCPAEGWWTSTLTPTQSLILPNEEERSRSSGSLFILFISLTLLPWVFVCECVDRATLQIDKDKKRLKWRLWSSTPKSNTPDCVKCSFRYNGYVLWNFTRNTFLTARVRDDEDGKKMPLWHFSLCWETFEGSPSFPEVSKSQGQRSLSQLRRGKPLRPQDLWPRT